MDLSGRFRSEIKLPKMFNYDPANKTGPRPNLSIEGLSFADGGRSLWLSLEAPLWQDGELAGASTGALVRLTRVDYKTGRLRSQFTYPVEPIGNHNADRLADNGVSEVLALDHQHILVLERSGIQQDDGRFRFRARIYCATTNGATDVSGMDSLKGRRVRSMRKNLVFDFTKIREGTIGNVEGMSFGPTLTNGHASLVVVTDNNFEPSTPTQVVALEIAARSANKELVRSLCRF
jgi:hypothetical protein